MPAASFGAISVAEWPAAGGAEVRPVDPLVAGEADGLRGQLRPARQQLFAQDGLSGGQVAGGHQKSVTDLKNIFAAKNCRLRTKLYPYM
jgi:hypothetical protein